VHWGILALVKTFVSPQTSLGDLDAVSAASLIAASSDVTLIVDAQGTTRDTAFQSTELMDELSESAQWVGRTMAATVAPDSRAKVETLLREAATAAEPKWRHINHLTPEGRSVPVLYCGVQVGEDGRVVGRPPPCGSRGLQPSRHTSPKPLTETGGSRSHPHDHGRVCGPPAIRSPSHAQLSWFP